jgi:glycosyltransferase involved in cell wall biosynthesis
MKAKVLPITVLMPVYNGEKYIAEAVQSVLDQSFADFELLIVNDGSTDNTEKVIRSFTDKRIVLLNRPNGGVSAALNTGLSAAKGKYIARFDADDVCYPQRLEKQHLFLESNPGYVMVGSDADYMSEEGEYLFTYRNIGHSNGEIQERINIYCPFVHSTVMYLKDVILDCGAYEINAHTFEDYFLWTRVIKKGKVCNFKEPLIKVRFNPASVTVDEKDRDPLFVRLKKKALRTGEITDEEGAALLKSIKSLSPEKKESSYNRMLGKKYLWNNYQPAKARRHLLKAIRIEPAKLSGYVLLALTFFPKSLITALYNNKSK